MNDSLIKDRAIINIPKSAEKCLQDSGWTNKDVNYFVPHQTGNVILHACAKSIGIELDKVFLEGQKYYGNVSGATVPLSLCLLKQEGKLVDNVKILSATAGVGGNFGAFSYIHKNINSRKIEIKKIFVGKKILILGASGYIGKTLCQDLYDKGAELYLHANNKADNLKEFNTAKIFIADFNNSDSVQKFIQEVKDSTQKFDYFINLAGSTSENMANKVNFISLVQIINSILPQIQNTILNIGTASEDIEFLPGVDWVAANRAFHGYLASASGEFLKYGIKTKYLQIGFAEGGLAKNFEEKSIFKFMLSVRQEKKLSSIEISEIIQKSLLYSKVIRIDYNYENAMLLGRVAYKLEVDI